MSSDEEILFEGKTFQIVRKRFDNNDKSINVEIAKRSPGVRLIIVKNKKILIIKEFRFELNDYDYRLPGGKVFDKLKEYQESLKNEENILNHAIEAAKKECSEEAGMIVKKIRHYATSNAGLTVQWDLFYFVVDDFEESASGQNLGYAEEIYPEWKTFDEIKQLCLDDKMKEYRSVGVILSYILKNQH